MKKKSAKKYLQQIPYQFFVVAKNIICNKFQEKSPSFIKIAWISPKFSTNEISGTTFCPPCRINNNIGACGQARKSFTILKPLWVDRLTFLWERGRGWEILKKNLLQNHKTMKKNHAWYALHGTLLFDWNKTSDQTSRPPPPLTKLPQPPSTDQAFQPPPPHLWLEWFIP